MVWDTLKLLWCHCNVLKFNTLRTGQNGCYFADDAFKCISGLKENMCLWFRRLLRWLQKTTNQCWFRWWLDAHHVTSHYLNQSWPSSMTPLRWRHNGRDSLSNHQPQGCLLNRLLKRRSKKTSKLRVTGLCVGNSPGTGEFPAQMASNAENVSIWWRHHAYALPGPNQWTSFLANPLKNTL